MSGGGGIGGGGNPPPVISIVTKILTSLVTQIRIDFRDKDRFSGSDYEIWSMHMQGIFEEHELWDIVSGVTKEPAAGHADLPQWKKNDKKARNIILSCLDKSMMLHTTAAPTSNDV